MYCTQCGTQNPSDSKFCRECGVKIVSVHEVEPLRLSVFQDLTQKAEAQEEPADPKLKHLLDMAFWHKNAGNARGAILACEAALILNPDSATALGLLGCLYEETGRDEDAIVMFERLVTLNPASTADAEKLEMLRKGIKVKSVDQPALYRWTPPALAQAFREPRVVAGIGAAATAIVVLVLGVAALHAMIGAHPATAAAASPETAPLSTSAAPARSASASPTSTPVLNQKIVPVIVASPATTVDPYAQAALIARLAKAQPSPNPGRLAAQKAKHSAREAAMQDFPPLPVISADQPAAVPSVVDVRPLRPVRVSSEVPNHYVPVIPVTPQPQHTVVVEGTQNSDSTAAPPDDPNQPAPPQSQIEISVHDTSASASDSSVGNGRSTITLREDPGAALQQKALSYQQQSDYGQAAAAYQTAIGAYRQDLAAGRNTDEARRGIAACETGLQICKQSQ